MAYQLKSTGIAANCTMLIAVDPDTGTIKDFADSSVTADMTVGANVTIGTGTWDGNTRHWFQLGAGTTADDFVAFGTTKPAWSNNVNGTARTWVSCGEAASAQIRAFGKDTSHYACSNSIAGGGSTHPTQSGMGFSTPATGAGAAISSGNKIIFGFSTVHGSGSGSGFSYSALHDAASMTKVDVGAPTSTSTTGNHSLDYVGRVNSSTSHAQHKFHFIAIFDIALSEAEWDSLRDDWRTVLIEQEADTTAPILSVPTAVVTGQTTATIGATTDEANGTMSAVVTTSSTAPSVAQIVAGQDHTGAAAVFDGNTAISATGANTIAATGLTANTAYYAHLFHEDAAGNDSNVVTTAQFTTLPNAPTAPTIGAETDVANNTATINWTDNSSNETSFTVQIETPSGAGNWVNAATGASNPTAANATSLAISGLSSGTQYRARVRASNTGGDSAWSTGSAFTTTSAGGGSSALPKLMQLILN